MVKTIRHVYVIIKPTIEIVGYGCFVTLLLFLGIFDNVRAG